MCHTGVCEGYVGHSECDPISHAAWIMEFPLNQCNVVAVRLLEIYWSSCFFAAHLPNPTTTNKNDLLSAHKHEIEMVKSEE